MGRTRGCFASECLSFQGTYIGPERVDKSFRRVSIDDGTRLAFLHMLHRDVNSVSVPLAVVILRD